MKISRVQSPSSINTYKQCPRKYYYQYIEELTTKPSIHLIRGKIAHSVLEDFFKVNIENISEESYDFEFKIILHELLSKHWQDSKEALSSLDLRASEVNFYLEETKQMLQYWLIDFIKKLSELRPELNFKNAFKKLTPNTEVYLCSKENGVQGYIDAIYDDDDVKIIDYKTSKRNHMSPAYKLQLAIYAMLYNEEYSRLPDQVGIHFLKFDEKCLDVDQDLVEFAKSECRLIHKNTLSNDIKDYPRQTSPLCKWSSGQCDFYKICNN